MNYMGSKTRIAKYILSIVLKGREKDQYYIEPFVGGANVIDKVKGKRLAADSNECLIEALKLIRDNLEALPKNQNETSEDKYKAIKYSDDKALKGYYGFALSYAGKWFGGWRRDSKGKRDYIAEAYRNAVEQSRKLKGIEFVCCSYDEIVIPAGSIIYCDPPYRDTTSYKNKFDHDKFWNWVRLKSREGHRIYVSEYTAPDDFQCIWKQEINSSLTKDTGSKKAEEKLFIWKGDNICMELHKELIRDREKGNPRQKSIFSKGERK